MRDIPTPRNRRYWTDQPTCAGVIVVDRAFHTRTQGAESVRLDVRHPVLVRLPVQRQQCMLLYTCGYPLGHAFTLSLGAGALALVSFLFEQLFL